VQQLIRLLRDEPTFRARRPELAEPADAGGRLIETRCSGVTAGATSGSQMCRLDAAGSYAILTTYETRSHDRQLRSALLLDQRGAPRFYAVFTPYVGVSRPLRRARAAASRRRRNRLFRHRALDRGGVEIVRVTWRTKPMESERSLVRFTKHDPPTGLCHTGVCGEGGDLHRNGG
jgi:hypothetical protein